MKNEVNRAIMAKKKQYIYPETCVECVNSRLMSITHEASLLPGPGAPQRRWTEVF